MPDLQHSSYQNGTNGVQEKEEDSHVLPMSDYIDMERRKRNRLIFILALFSSVLAVIAAVAVWRVHQVIELVAIEAPSKQAAGALDRLNKHLHSQSTHISTQCESTILLTRHCEKVGPNVEDVDGNVHCSYLGLERAAFLATLFGTSKDTRWPVPSHLFALTPDRGTHWNFREWESLYPLSKAIGVSTDLVNGPDLAETYFSLLQSGDLCGKLTVVSWQHDDLPELAIHLGCGSDNGCPDVYPDEEFDQVWQLKYVFHPIMPDVEEVEDDERDMYKSNSSTSPPMNAAINSTSTAFFHRHLKSAAHKRKQGWSVFATVAKQNFDPLSFSKLHGDYPESGTPSGGRWQDEEEFWNGSWSLMSIASQGEI
jgi:hypothetical protein